MKIKFEEKTGNGVFQDLWFRVLMPSLIFGQFAAKLENKIRFGRSVGGSNMGRLAAKYRSFIPFKKKWPATTHQIDTSLPETLWTTGKYVEQEDSIQPGHPSQPGQPGVLY